MHECIILVGNIGAGKSTWVRKHDKPHIVINDDAIVNALHGGVYKKYKAIHKPLYKTIENVIFGFVASCQSSVDIIVDRPNLTVKTRRRYIGLAHAFDMNVRAIVFPFEHPHIHADRRMQDDGRGYTVEYWERVVNNKNKQYQVPTLEEGIDFMDFIT